VTHKLVIGVEADLIRNIHGIAELAGLDGDELGCSAKSLKPGGLINSGYKRMGNVKFSLVVLKTRQVESLRRFYGSLGIEFAEEQHGTGPVHFAGRVGDVVLELYPLPEGNTSADSTTRLGFTVEKLDDVVQTLQTVKALVVTEPQMTTWGFRAVVRDPDGRAVELYQR
jgi:lactoylglutathione lyase